MKHVAARYDLAWLRPVSGFRRAAESGAPYEELARLLLEAGVPVRLPAQLLDAVAGWTLTEGPDGLEQVARAMDAAAPSSPGPRLYGALTRDDRHPGLREMLTEHSRHQRAWHEAVLAELWHRRPGAPPARRTRRRGGTPRPVPEDGPRRLREAGMTAAAPAVALDAGSRYLRVVRADGDGPPRLVDLPGTVPGEGLPTPDRVRGDRAAALAAAYAAYRAHCGPPGRLVAVVPHGEHLPPTRETGEPRAQLLGAPHAVLALLRHAGTPPLSPVLVCDLGGAGVSLARCVLTGGTWAVCGPARYAPVPGGYGAAFDRAVLDGAGLPPTTRRSCVCWPSPGPGPPGGRTWPWTGWWPARIAQSGWPTPWSTRWRGTRSPPAPCSGPSPVSPRAWTGYSPPRARSVRPWSRSAARPARRPWCGTSRSGSACRCRCRAVPIRRWPRSSGPRWWPPGGWTRPTGTRTPSPCGSTAPWVGCRATRSW
ncbi:hypothetical protein NQP46_02350 [Streptomyces albus]|nr:hypothetical protein NQP46_02350 [Streptomyces albus]